MLAMSENRPTPERIMQMAWGYAPPLAIDAAVTLGVFDALAEGPRSLADVARATEASPRGLRGLCNGLVGLELLIRDDDDRYALAPDAAAFLVRGKPGYHGPLIRHIAGQILPNWLGLTDAVRTGEPAKRLNDETGGAAFFETFVEGLFVTGWPAASALARELAPRLDALGDTATALDIAAGSGVWSVALAERCPALRVRAVDWERVLPVTRRVTERHGVASRFALIAGDILEADLGRGHAVATLGHILHSEGEERSRKLLGRVFSALAPGGTIAIAEFVPDDDRRGPPQPLLFALNMLVLTENGDVFTFADLARLLTEAGFENARMFPVPGPSPLVLAERPA